MKRIAITAAALAALAPSIVLLWIASAPPPTVGQDTAVPRPNILLIVADDLGWKDVGYHGAPFKTPNIDKLVATGIELDSHYVQPVCTPTRTALLSGRYPSRFGPHTLTATNLRALPPGTETLASALKATGYTTYISGKWHLGSRPEWWPNHYGFDHSYGSITGAVDPWTHRYRPGAYERAWHRDDRPLDEEGNATELEARQAVEWIRVRQSPWFVYVPLQAVHIPVDTPPEYKALYANSKFDDDPVKDESRRRLAAFVSQLDAKVGDLIRALDESGQRDNTLVIFTSDNGGTPGGDNPYVGNVPPSPALSSNEPLRGHKGQLYEGGTRVPAFVNWPGRLAHRKVTAPLHAVDWVPTLTRLAGYQPKRDLKWDGQDIWPILTGAAEHLEPRTIYIALRSGQAIHHGGWKLIAYVDGREELYHLAVDPYETTNLAATEPTRLEELKKILAETRKADVEEIPADLRNVEDIKRAN
jgi:arylsulfatase A-like enzyme